MNSLTIIGNVTKDCELRTTPTGVNVCTFTVAVNDKYNKDEPAQFFRVTAWRKLGESCANFVKKGMKVCVVGPVKDSAFKDKDGIERHSLAVTANDVEFLTRVEGNNDGGYAPSEDYNNAPEVPEDRGFTAVETDELPF